MPVVLEVAATTDAEDGTTEAGGTTALLAPYPNPSRRGVTLPLVLREASAVRVAVYDVLGREVAALHAGPLGAGAHRLRLDASALPAGVYVVRAAVGSDAAVFMQRLTLLR